MQGKSRKPFFSGDTEVLSIVTFPFKQLHDEGTLTRLKSYVYYFIFYCLTRLLIDFLFWRYILYMNNHNNSLSNSDGQPENDPGARRDHFLPGFHRPRLRRGNV